MLPVVDAAKSTLPSGDPEIVFKAVYRGTRKLLQPNQCFVGLSHDALRHYVPDSKLAEFRFSWATFV